MGEQPRGMGGGDVAPAFIVLDLRSALLWTARVCRRDPHDGNRAAELQFGMSTALRRARHRAPHRRASRHPAAPARHQQREATMNYTPWSSTDANRTTATPKLLDRTAVATRDAATTSCSSQW